MNRLIVIFGFYLLIVGCSSIWNGADLHDWVKDQAVESGCKPESIVLDDWYTSENGKNIWRGNCTDSKSGDNIPFGIGVVKVWKPSTG